MGAFYTIQNVRYDTEYIGYNAPGGKPNPGQRVIGTDSPINWIVSQTPGGYK